MKSSIIKGSNTTKGVFIKASISKSSNILFLDDLNIIKTASGAVPLIRVANKRATKIELLGNILSVNKVRNTAFNSKNIPVNSKANVDKFVNSLSLNLELESKIISTSANTLIDVKKVSGKYIIGPPL